VPAVSKGCCLLCRNCENMGILLHRGTMEPRSGNASYAKCSKRFIENDGTMEGGVQIRRDASGGKFYHT